MACRHTEIDMLEDDKEKIKTAIEKLVAALDKSNCVGEDCEVIDTNNKKTFRTRNIEKLSYNLQHLNDKGEEAITRALVRMRLGLASLEILLAKYRTEDAIFHAIHPDAEIPEESEESA